MEPVSVALLAALAGGLGGEAGRHAWQELAALVRRPFRRAGTPPDEDTTAAVVSTGEPELTALAQAPDDDHRAHALSTALAVRAALDSGFRQGLEEWRQLAERAGGQGGGVTNQINGGVFHHPVIQSGSISDVTFTSPPPPPPSE